MTPSVIQTETPPNIAARLQSVALMLYLVAGNRCTVLSAQYGLVADSNYPAALDMTLSTLSESIAAAVPALLDLARSLTWNKISDNCTFILSEIENSSEGVNMLERKRRLKAENDRKVPVSFPEAMRMLSAIYDNLYDINLQIFQARKNQTIIDIRYYPKSALDQEFRQQVLNNPSMLHCKVATPPWLSDKKEKFDIHWEYRPWLIRWKLFWMGRKLRRMQRSREARRRAGK